MQPTGRLTAVPAFGKYLRDGAGIDYADQRYYNQQGSFWTPDPMGLKTVHMGNPGSWNRYAYAGGDPISFNDPSGTNRAIPDPPPGQSTTTMLGEICWYDEDWGWTCTDDLSTGSGAPSGVGDLTTSPSGPGPSNPCAYGSLTSAQQTLLGSFNWGAQSAAAQQTFTTISADTAALGLNLAGLTVSSITVAGQNGQTETELNLAGGNINALISSLGSNFTSQAQDPLVGTPHPGYMGNYRQNTVTWSMQVNTGVDPTTGQAIVQIDIDPYNPASGLAGLLGHGLLQWI